MQTPIKAFLFDLDGVFYVSNQQIEGANATIAFLKSQKIPYRFVTNNTLLSRESLCIKLQKLGLNIHETEVISANYAGVLFLNKLKPASCKLILREEAKDDYSHFKQVRAKPEVVLIGDIDRAWTFDLMNELMQDVLHGAQLLALHKGRYFETNKGLQIDAGAFVAGLEYVCRKEAIVLGKPSPDFFKLAASDFPHDPKHIAMVGDDLYNDIEGAQKMGYQTILVKTGKYRPKLVSEAHIKPDFIIESIAGFKTFLKKF